jgi:hypothetical protein
MTQLISIALIIYSTLNILDKVREVKPFDVRNDCHQIVYYIIKS